MIETQKSKDLSVQMMAEIQALGDLSPGEADWLEKTIDTIRQTRKILLKEQKTRIYMCSPEQLFKASQKLGYSEELTRGQSIYPPDGSII